MRDVTWATIIGAPAVIVAAGVVARAYLRAYVRGRARERRDRLELERVRRLSEGRSALRRAHQNGKRGEGQGW